MAGLPGFTTRFTSLHLSAGCQCNNVTYLKPLMSIAVVNNYCRKRLHVQEFRGKRDFDKEAAVFNSILLKLFFLLMNTIYSPSILTFLSSWRSLNTVLMVGTRECELPERRSKQQNGLKNF